MIFATIATLLLCTLPGYVPGEAAWYVSQWADGLVITLWVYRAFRLTPEHEFDRKFFMSAVVAVCLVNNIIYPLWVLNPHYEYVAYPLYLSAVTALLFRVRWRNYQYEGSSINSETVALCFWRPKKAGSFFHSFFGAPVASVGVYAGGLFWSYRWKQPGFTCRRVPAEQIQKKYIVVNTEAIADDMVIAKLYNLIGTPARQFKTFGLRANCVLTITPVLQELGAPYKPKPLEFLPSLYAGRILNDAR